MSDINVPRNNKYMDSKKSKAQNQIESAFDDFKKLLSDKTHPENQTPAYHKNVVTTLQRLLIAADEMDGVNPGEGIFGLIILSLRSCLKLRDSNRKLQVEVKDLRVEINKLKKNQKIK